MTNIITNDRLLVKYDQNEIAASIVSSIAAEGVGGLREGVTDRRLFGTGEDLPFSSILIHSTHPCLKVFLKISQINRKTPVTESLFNKDAGLRAGTLLKKILWHATLLKKIPST